MDTLYKNSEKIISAERLPFDPEPGGLGKTFFTKMAESNDSIAQVDGYTGESDTYSALLHRCVRTAIAMRKRGILPDDIISICGYNHLNTAVPFIAGLFIGAVSANLDPRYSLNDAVQLIKQVRPKIFFVCPESVELIESSLKECEINSLIVVFGRSDKFTEFSEFIEPSDEETSFIPIEVDSLSTAVICFSSGTTGLPKGICLNHFGLLCQAMRLGYTGVNIDTYLQFATLNWFTAVYATTSCIVNKTCKVVVPKFDVDTVWHVLSQTKVTAMFLVPYQANLIITVGRSEGVNTHLKYVSIAGSHIRAQLVYDFASIFPETQISVGYGLTEVFGVCTSFKPNCVADNFLFQNKPTSVGRRCKHGKRPWALPARRAAHQEPIANERLLQYGLLWNEWDTGGWLRSGDIAYYDDDNCFYIIDRIKEMIKFRFNVISPASIEEVLISHPGVEAAIVVGLQHPCDVEHPVGAVVLKKDAVNEFSAQDVLEYVNNRVDDPKRLRGGIKLVKSLPLTPSGKINRQLLRKMILQGDI